MPVRSVVAEIVKRDDEPPAKTEQQLHETCLAGIKDNPYQVAICLACPSNPEKPPTSGRHASVRV